MSDLHISQIEARGPIAAIHQAVNRQAPSLYAVADYIHANPELGMQEFKAQSRLVAEFEERGFAVETGVASLETAFKASLRRSNGGPTVAFLAEYDALPKIGHGCGHNLICTAALGAATALKEMASDLPGNVVVVGTPAEEVPPPLKGQMVDAGVFADVDVAMMTHGRDRTHVGGQLMAADSMRFRYQGKASHAAARPEQGVSALDAALFTMHAIETLREHARSDVRIHGIVVDGGQAANIVPEHAELQYFARALDRPYLETIVARLEDCARAGALATGASVEIISEGKWEPRLNVPPLNALLLENARLAGAERIMEPPSGFGSADFGNLTQRLPAATLYVEMVPHRVSLHTREAATAAGGEPGRHVIRVGAKAMAATAYALLTNSQLLAQVKAEFARAKEAEPAKGKVT